LPPKLILSAQIECVHCNISKM